MRSESRQRPDHVGLHNYGKDFILGVIGSHWGGFQKNGRMPKYKVNLYFSLGVELGLDAKLSM